MTLHVWGVRRTGVPAALARMALHRRRLATGPDRPGFARLLGTGHGRTFAVRDADPCHWALLASWPTAALADRFEDGPVARSWEGIAHERLRLTMRPLASRGTWSGQRPFGEPAAQAYDGPVAALTRARIAPRHALTFWRAVPPVAADLRGRPGARLALGIGEAPVGWQGTFSVWDSADALHAFAYTGEPHAAVVRRTAEVGWYAESLFARFAVASVDGTYEGQVP